MNTIVYLIISHVFHIAVNVLWKDNNYLQNEKYCYTVKNRQLNLEDLDCLGAYSMKCKSSDFLSV